MSETWAVQTTDLPLLDRYPDLAVLFDAQGRPLYLNPSARGLQQRLGRELQLEPQQSQATFEMEGMPRLTYTLHWSRVDWQGASAWMVFARRELAKVEAPATRVMTALDPQILEAELQETQRLLVDGLLEGEPPAEWVQRLEEITRGPSERMLDLVDRNLRLAGLNTYYQSRIQQLEHWQREARGRMVDLEQRLAAAPSVSDPHTQRLAYEDPLTQTPNANILLPYLEQVAGQVERGEGSAALLLIDIDLLHNLSEILGREAGDAVLRQLSQRIRGQMRPEDVLGRLQSGEFAVVVQLPLGGAEGRAPLTQVTALLAQRVLAAVAEPVQLERQAVETTASIGILVLTGAAPVTELLEQAGVALRQARRSGRGRHQFYSDEVQQRHMRDVSLVRQLEGALERGEFTLRFQPVVDLKTGKVVAAEALLRWAHPAQGLLEPGTFLEVADHAGFLVAIGEWAIREACAQVLAFGKGLTVMCNVSSRQVLQADLARRLMKAWERSKLRAENLVVEVPEAVLVSDPDRAEKLGRELSRCRVQVAVDNFGYEFSSLKRIKRMGATYLKLDASLVARLPAHDDHYRLCRAAILAGGSVGMTCVGKAVETREQAAALKGLGCQLGQGNFFSAPVAAQDFGALLKKTWKI